MRTVLDLDRDAEQLLHPREAGLDARRRSACRRRSPAATTVRAAASLPPVAAQHVAPSASTSTSSARDGVRPARAAAKQDAVAPDDHGAIDERRRRACARTGTTSMRENLRRDPAARARADSGTAPPGRTRRRRACAACADLLGLEQPSVARHDPRHGVDLRVLDAGREPDAAHRQARAPHAASNHAGARLARHVGVVEHDARGAGADQRDRAPAADRAASLPPRRGSAARSPAPTNDPRQRALAGAGRPMIEHDLAIRLSARAVPTDCAPDARGRRPAGNRSSRRPRSSSVSAIRSRARERLRPSRRASAPGIGTIELRQIHAARRARSRTAWRRGAPRDRRAPGRPASGAAAVGRRAAGTRAARCRSRRSTRRRR